jgi:hypothetical protein
MRGIRRDGPARAPSTPKTSGNTILSLPLTRTPKAPKQVRLGRLLGEMSEGFAASYMDRTHFAYSGVQGLTYPEDIEYVPVTMETH